MAISIIPQKAYPSIFTPSIVMQYLKLDDTSDNEIISTITDYAVSYAQKMTNNLVSKDVYTVKVSDIQSQALKLQLYPIISIDKIKVNDTILEKNTDYITRGNLITFNTTTPITECEVILTGGYSNTSALSPELRMAVLMHISAAYDNRSGSSAPVPFAVSNIYNKIVKLRMSFSNT